jgi:UDP-glucose 4-epimerase
MTSVLVTGGARYIGSHAVKALREQGARGVVYDNLSAGHREAARHASALVVGDIHDAARMRGAIREHQVDAVMASTAYNLGNGRPTSVRTVIDSVERVVGRKVPFTVGPRRPGDPGVLFAASERMRAELGWSPRFEDIDVIVETAWRWREAHPSGYRKATA